jgi:Na+-transporting NADH:ubiquinone oxidoreductase subunit A
MIKITKGLDLPIQGAPKQNIQDGNSVTRVAGFGEEYIGIRTNMHVQ